MLYLLYDALMAYIDWSGSNHVNVNLIGMYYPDYVNLSVTIGLDAAKVAECARKLGVSRLLNGAGTHPYRVHSAQVKLIDGQLVGDTFTRVFTEAEVIRYVETCVVPLIDKHTIDKPIVISGHNNSEPLAKRMFYSQIGDNGSACLYLWFSKYGELLYVGETYVGKLRINKYYTVQVPNRSISLAFLRARHILGVDSIFPIAIMLPESQYGSDKLARCTLETLLLKAFRPSCNLTLNSVTHVNQALGYALSEPQFLFQDRTGKELLYAVGSLGEANARLKLNPTTVHKFRKSDDLLYNVVLVRTLQSVDQQLADRILDGTILPRFKDSVEFMAYVRDNPHYMKAIHAVDSFTANRPVWIHDLLLGTTTVHSSQTQAIAFIKGVMGTCDREVLNEAIVNSRVFNNLFVVISIDSSHFPASVLSEYRMPYSAALHMLQSDPNYMLDTFMNVTRYYLTNMKAMGASGNAIELKGSSTGKSTPFSSLREAGKFLDVSKTTVSSHMRSGKPLKGYCVIDRNIPRLALAKYDAKLKTPSGKA